MRSVVSSANSLVAVTPVTLSGAVGVLVLLLPPLVPLIVAMAPPIPASALQYSCTPTMLVPVMARTRKRR